MTLGNRTIRNSLYSAAGLLWTMGLVLLTQPYMFSRLGRDHYGLMMLVSSTLATLGVLTAGFGDAALRYIADSHSRNDIAGMNAFVSTSLLAFLVVSGIGAVALTVLAPKLAQEFFLLPAVDQALARRLFRLGGILLVTTSMLGLLMVCMKAAQRYDVANRCRIAVGTAGAFGIVLVLWAGMGLVSVIVASILVTAVGIVVVAQVARRHIPGLRVWPGLSLPALRRLAGYAGVAVVPALGGIAFAQFDKMLVGAILGSAALAYYTIPLSLAQQVHGVVASVAEVVFPVSSSLEASGAPGDLERLYLLASKAAATLGMALAIPLVCLATPLLLHWMGGEVAINSARALQFQAISYFFMSSSAVPYYVLNGIGLPKVNAGFSVASGSVSIILNLILIPRFGIIGAALAGTANGLGALVLVAYVARVVFRRSPSAILRQIYLGPVLGAAVTSSILAVGLRWWPGAPGPIGLALLGVGGGCLVAALSLLLDRVQSAPGQDLFRAFRLAAFGSAESARLAGKTRIDRTCSR